MPARVLGGKTPIFILLRNKDPFALIPHVFGCLCYVYNHVTSIRKLDSRAIKTIFLKYSSIQKGYKCLDPITDKWYVLRNVTFMESIPYFPKTTSLEENLGQEEYSQELEIQFSDFLKYSIPKTDVPQDSI